MISLLHGIVKERKDQSIILDIGPIGLEIQVANSSLFNPGDSVTLFTHLHWNQEQGPSLFGFSTETDRHVFQLVIGCSGMGPKITLTILNQLGAASFLHAIQTNDEKRLSNVTGIGAKKAEQMIVHLRHKVKKLFTSGIKLDTTTIHASQHLNDVINALESLNYSRSEINKAMTHLSEEHDTGILSFEQLMRKALATLSKATR